MSIYFDTIEEAILHSRTYGEIATVETSEWETALDILRDSCTDEEEYDNVVNGDVLEFWSYTNDEMDMRIHLVK